MIDDFTIRKIRDAANVVDVLGEFIDLRRKGQDYEALCPFHDDRHLGSFKVSARRNRYTCFSCGAGGDSVEFLMSYQGTKYSFLEAIQWLGRKYGIDVEGSERFTPKPAKPHQPLPPLPMMELPMSMVEARLFTDNDPLCMWLRGLDWKDAAQRYRIDHVLKRYLVGHSRQGHTIFWQIDEKGRVRTGKMMKYGCDGHRDKVSKGNFAWIHSKLFNDRNLPQWDEEKMEYKQTLFGMHLLPFFPKATVNIVESEKTALIMSIVYGDFESRLWMASGGKSNLTREKLAPIIERKQQIVLYPDRDAIDEWKKMADSIGYEHLHVYDEFVTKHWLPGDGEKADIADVVLRMLDVDGRAKKAEALGEIIKRNPAVQELIDKLNLKIS